MYNLPLCFITQSQMDNTRGLIVGVRKELMREDVEEQFGKNQNDTDQITERALEAEDKVNNAKGTNLTVGPLLKRIMSAYRQLRKIRNVGETERSCVGGNPSDLLFCLNTGKLEATGTFSLEVFVNHLLVRGTISFYNKKLQVLPV